MVRDDDLEAKGVGVVNLLKGGGSAVQSDNTAESVLNGPIKAFLGKTVAFAASIGDVVSNIGTVLAQKTKTQSDRRGAVDIVIAVQQNSLPVINAFGHGFEGLVHAFHQGGIS